MSPTRLDLILVLTDVDLQSPEHWVDIPQKVLDRRDFGFHVMECHQRLAELGGPVAAAFRRVTEELARELRDESQGDSL